MDGMVLQQGVGAPNKVLGTTTNDSAAAGYVGEYISSTVAVASAVSLTTGTSADVTTISLTAGDWDVTGSVSFVTAGTTSVTTIAASTSTTTNTMDQITGNAAVRQSMAATVPGANNNAWKIGIPTRRISIAGTTTIYLVALGVFTVAALTAYGFIGARRAR